MSDDANKSLHESMMELNEVAEQAWAEARTWPAMPPHERERCYRELLQEIRHRARNGVLDNEALVRKIDETIEYVERPRTPDQIAEDDAERERRRLDNYRSIWGDRT